MSRAVLLDHAEVWSANTLHPLLVTVCNQRTEIYSIPGANSRSQRVAITAFCRCSQGDAIGLVFPRLARTPAYNMRRLVEHRVLKCAVVDVVFFVYYV